jgi:hypothetical protein
MTQAEIQLREKLIHVLQNLDAALLQRVSDFTQGILAASDNHQTDWWNELPDSLKKDYDEGLKEMEDGNETDVEDFLKKYRK